MDLRRMPRRTNHDDSDKANRFGYFPTSLGKPALKNNIQGSARPRKDGFISYRNGQKTRTTRWDYDIDS